MNPSSSYGHPGESPRPGFAHSTFSVGGMSASANVNHLHGHHSASPWGGASAGPSFGSSLTDSLSQPRPHYTPGYMMSTSQSASPQQNTQRYDDAPVVQTRAKINNALSRGSPSEFGMESMFQNTRKRPTLTDEDAPPTASVNDIVNEQYAPQTLPRESISRPSLPRKQQSTPTQAPAQTLYVVVFGYPPDKYSVTVEYFQSLGETLEPDQNSEIVNCFRIGYKNPGEAMRAVRKNGEVLGGTWMIGAKWADPAEAEAVLGQGAARGALSGYQTPGPSGPIGRDSMDIDMGADHAPSTPSGNNNFSALVATTTAVGTPIKLAPSVSAFRKAGAKPSTPAHGTPAAAQTVAPGVSPSPNKGVLGQMSDLIFGW